MYKVIPEFPRWEINSEGNIRNVLTKVDKFVYINKQGYMATNFKIKGKSVSRKVHRLVGELFLPEPEDWLVELCSFKWPYKPCINHIDHNKLNNNVSNLEWCDINHNNQAAIVAGVVPLMKGSLNGMAVLNEDLVHAICEDYENGMTPKEAVIKYGISRSQSTKIRAGIQWKHIWHQYNIKPLRQSKTEEFNDQSESL